MFGGMFTVDGLKITEVPSIAGLNLLSVLPYQCGRSCYTHGDICPKLSRVDHPIDIVLTVSL